MRERFTNPAAVRKPDRLRFNSDFAYLRERGVKTAGRLLVLVTAPPRQNDAAAALGVKAGVVCGRKYSPLAVRRNRARRLLWESFRHLKSRIRPVELVMIPRYRMMDVKEPEVRKELAELLEKAGVYTPEEPTGDGSATGRDV